MICKLTSFRDLKSSQETTTKKDDSTNDLNDIEEITYDER